jgi:hypothetical protein
MKQQTWEEYADSLPGETSDGQRALEAVEWHRANLLPCPDWVLETIADCYFFFKVGAPVSGWIQDQRKENAPKTLGEAFGIADHKNFHAQKKRMRAALGPQILHRFNRPGGLSKNETNYEAVGSEFGLTVDEVRAIVIKRKSSL